jgi:DNA-directed RNA polymerase I subunit RPA2
MLEEGLSEAVQGIPPVVVALRNGTFATMWLEEPLVQKPMKSEDCADSRLFPSECRERHLKYDAPLLVTVNVQVTGAAPQRFQKRFGSIPIMVGSRRCHLEGLSPKGMVQRKEEANEMGGYFICNGIERVVRLLQTPKRNHMQAVQRSAFAGRGPLYTDKAIMLKSVRRDQTAVTNTLHMLSNGDVRLRFSVQKQEFFIPVVLVIKALMQISDRSFYHMVLRGHGCVGTKEQKSVAGAAATSLAAVLAIKLETLLQHARDTMVFSRQGSLAYIGSRFRVNLEGLAPDLTDEQVGEELLARYVLVHLQNGEDKANLLLLMIRKLYLFSEGEVCEDSSDALSNQELLLSGHLYQMFVKEKLHEALMGVRAAVIKDDRDATNGRRQPVNLNDLSYFKMLLERSGDIGAKIANFLSTGNIISSSGLDLMQVSGFTIVAEKLNFLRYCAHFRSVHRGQFFTTMKTTAVRKLLPESWGFMCPVHTPDGSPCGLLNHLAAQCVLATHPIPEQVTDVDFPRVLADLGMLSKESLWRSPSHLPVMLDGRLIGAVGLQKATHLVRRLRQLKREVLSRLNSAHGTQPEASKHGYSYGSSLMSSIDWSSTSVPPSLECVLVLPHKLTMALQKASANTVNISSTEGEDGSVGGSTAPGLFLFTEPGRMVRAVAAINDDGQATEVEGGASIAIELISPMEQLFMDIAVLQEDVRPGVTTHREICSTNMFSLVASMTPFSDCNQSPRNMYQCQMAKQTMGTPIHSYRHRVDNKMYRVQTPQVPIVQNQRQKAYNIDEYPLGTNAVVAVISYTGFDMEDAMILNKSSYERGFGHGSVYKTMSIKLDGDKARGSTAEEGEQYFSNIVPKGSPMRKRKLQEAEERGGGPPLFCDKLDEDGLPMVGDLIKHGDVIACTVNATTGEPTLHKHKDGEEAYIEQVSVLGSEGSSGGSHLKAVDIKLRFNRNPIVGDKFSSRHGQKGVMSVLWPQVDMPFTESGMSPDVIINPHAFPSRMTIGMLIESMAAKAGALHGVFQDGTPFRFHERQRAVDYFGEQLRSAGYSYVGSEPLYSGITGTEMHADIYIGLVYYQRLRHMVSDKSQVRATGPVNRLTRQPIKGRKKHGGIRLGEMERDALLAHGAAYLLRDRLMNCSDKHIAAVCTACHSLLSPCSTRHVVQHAGEDLQTTAEQAQNRSHLVCRVCQDLKRPYTIAQVPLPYVFRYLANELAGMNIKLQLKVSS